MVTDYHSRKKLEGRYQKCKAENTALKRKIEVVQYFGAWLDEVCHDDRYRLDGGGYSYAELLDYIWSVFEPLAAEEQT